MERRAALRNIFIRGPLLAAASLGLISCGSKLKLETTDKLLPTTVPRPTAHPEQQTPTSVITAQFAPETTPNGADLLEKAKAEFQLPIGEELDRVAGGAVRFYHLHEGEGDAYFSLVFTTDPNVSIDLLTADNATPTTLNNDTEWSDGLQHTQPLPAMADANATRNGKQLVFAETGDYYGRDIGKTSPEGTVVHDGQILRVNPNRATYTLDAQGNPLIGRFEANVLQYNKVRTAFGAGPVVIHQGLVCDPHYDGSNQHTSQWNPLNEGFKYMDYRIQLYTNNSPQTMIGYGTTPEGVPFTIMVTSRGIIGLNLALKLQEMGITEAMLLDGDSQTTHEWRGHVHHADGSANLSTAVAAFVTSL